MSKVQLKASSGNNGHLFNESNITGTDIYAVTTSTKEVLLLGASYGILFGVGVLIITIVIYYNLTYKFTKPITGKKVRLYKLREPRANQLNNKLKLIGNAVDPEFVEALIAINKSKMNVKPLFDFIITMIDIYNIDKTILQLFFLNNYDNIKTDLEQLRNSVEYVYRPNKDIDYELKLKLHSELTILCRSLFSNLNNALAEFYQRSIEHKEISIEEEAKNIIEIERKEV